MMQTIEQSRGELTDSHGTLGDAAAASSMLNKKSSQQTGLQPKTAAAKLHPKEHGAYAIFGIPMATALITSNVTPLGVCVAVAAVTAFLAHEPLVVAWGHRGRRAQRSTPTAKSRLALLLLIMLGAGCIALLAGDQSVRLALVSCLALAVSSFALALAGRHRTLVGQLWGVVGLSSPCVPILIAGGTGVATAIAPWMVWILGFWATTIAVRSVIAAQKQQPRWPCTLILTAISLTVVCTSAAQNVHWPLVTLPMIALSWYLLIAPPPAMHLRGVGWTSVVASVLTAALMIGTFSGSS